MSSSKDKVKVMGKIWAKMSNEEDICERDPNGLFFIYSLCGEINMRRNFYSGNWIDLKRCQLRYQKKQNVISEKAWLDIAVRAETKRTAKKQSSIISIVSLTKRSIDDSPDNV